MTHASLSPCRMLPALCATLLMTVPAWSQGLLMAQSSAAPAPGLKAAPAATGIKPPRAEIEIGYGRETLSNNLPDWKQAYVLASYRIGDRQTLYGGLRETRRFGLTDSEAHAGFYSPLGKTWTSQLELGLSPTHEVLPRYSLYGQLHKILGDGWGAGLGLRHSEYTLTATNTLSLMAERYWRNFRGAYTLYSGRPEGAASASSHRFQLNYYYADRSAVGLSYSTGREVEYLGPSRGVISSDVQNWTLSGQHWFTPAWALTYDLVNQEQGSLYRRLGLQFGLRYSF